MDQEHKHSEQQKQQQQRQAHDESYGEENEQINDDNQQEGDEQNSNNAENDQQMQQEYQDEEQENDGDNDKIQQGQMEVQNQHNQQEEHHQQEGQQQQQNHQQQQQEKQIEQQNLQGQKYDDDAHVHSNQIQQPQNLIQNKQEVNVQQEKNKDNNEPNITPHQIMQKQQPSKPQQQPSIPKQTLKIKQRQKDLPSYTNRLQKQLQQKQQNILDMISEAMAKANQLRQVKKCLIQKNNKLENKTQQLNTLSAQFQKLDRLRKNQQLRISDLESQLETYREVGDIRSVLNKVEELQTMVKSLTNQLQITKASQQSNQIPQIQAITKQQLENIENLHTQNLELKQSIKYLTNQLNSYKDKNIKTNHLIQQLDGNLKDKISKIDSLKQQNQQLLKHLKQQRQSYEGKIQKLQHYLNAAHNLGDGEEHRNQRDLEKKLEQDKQAFYREYKQLQLENVGLQQTNYDLKNKLHSLRMQMKVSLKSKVNKKDYDEMVIKYKKAKQCLERVIAENKILRNSIICKQKTDNQQNSIQQLQNHPHQGIINNKQSIQILQNYYEHDNIQEYMKIFGKHLKQSLQYFKNTHQILESIHIDQYKQQIYQLTNQKNRNGKKVQQLERMNNVLEKQLLFKNNIYDEISRQNRLLREKVNGLQKEKRKVQWELIDENYSREQMRKLQLSSVGLITKNRKLVTQMEKWKNLYLALKSQYEAFLRRQPHDPNNKQPRIQQQGQIMIDENKDNGQPKGSQLQVEKMDAQTQIQQNMNNFYYRELKQVLSILKKFPKTTKQLISGLESKKTELEEIRKKQQNMQSSYNKKLQDLQLKEKKNDSLLAQRKQELLNEFYDVRELIQNNRLIDSLRKAKNLIQALEKQDDEQPEEQ